jgi:hypothetical protein
MDDLVAVGKVFPIGVMITILTESLGMVTLPFIAKKVQTHANAVLQNALLGEGFCSWSPFLQVEEAHLEALVGEFFLRFFLSSFLLVTAWLLLATSTLV